MIAKPLGVGLLAAACVTAAAAGAYVAIRQNESEPVVPVQSASSVPATIARPVAETEAVVNPSAAVERATPATDSARTNKPTPAPAERPVATPRKEGPPASRSSQSAGNRSQPVRPSAEPALDQPQPVERTSPSREPVSAPPASSSSTTPTQAEPVVPADAPAVPIKPQFVEVIVPASSVVGLQVETSVTSETAKVEDRIEARVTRDVMADGRVAIPAGTRVMGDVTLVERGGKMKDKARLGVRFHTLVLADSSQVALRTDSIYREGASPGAESARKIGGAAIGGAILGAIMGGAKGAAIGGATGAAGGGAVVMAGDRNAATLPAGTIVTVRLASPVAIDVEREPDIRNP